MLFCKQQRSNGLPGNNSASKDYKVSLLSAKFKEKQEKLENLIAELVEESAKGKPIIAEGKKDAIALKTLGVNSTILTVKTGGKSFLKASQEIEELGVLEVILLLDFDRRGVEGTMRLVGDLEKLKIKANVKFWHQLRGLVSRDVQCIEGLPSFLMTLQQNAR
jgi:2,5-diamino-6-(ribosylamino)-4(3H)-pyrimidinone 5'-phosphate reductase